MKYKLYLAIIGLIMSISLMAQDVSPWRWSLDNALYLQNRVHFQESQQAPALQWQSISNHTAKVIYKDRLSLHTNIRTTLSAHDSRRNRAFVNELYGQLQLENIKFNLGKLMHDWGQLTGISVLDIAHVYDYFDLIDTDQEQLGKWSAQVAIELGPFQLSLTGLERNNNSRLYINDHRWINTPSTTLLPSVSEDPIPLVMLDLVEHHSKRKWQGVIEAQLDLNKVQLGYQFFSGNNDIPQRSISVQNVTTAAAQYNLNLVYHPLTVHTLQASTYFGSWNIWTEVGHITNQTTKDNMLIDDRYWQLMIGIDRVFHFEDPEKQLKILTQYSKIIDDGTHQYGATDLDHIFQSAWIADLDFRLNYNWKISLRAVRDFSKNGTYIQPKIQRRISDILSLQVAADLLSGSEAGFFGNYSNNSRISTQLKLYF